MEQTSEQLQAQIDALTLKLTKVKEQEAKEAETLKIFTDKVDAANSKIEVLIDSIIEETGLKLKDLHYRKKTALEISGKTSESSTSNATNTPKKKRDPLPTRFAFINDAGDVQSVSAGVIGDFKNKGQDFVNKHKVTHRQLVDGKWLFWNEHIDVPKPEWVNDKCLVNVDDYIPKVK